MRTVLQTVRRIADEILGVKGLTYGTDPYSSPRWGGGGGVGEFWLCQDKICPMTPLVPFPSLPPTGSQFSLSMLFRTTSRVVYVSSKMEIQLLIILKRRLFFFLVSSFDFTSTVSIH